MSECCKRKTGGVFPAVRQVPGVNRQYSGRHESLSYDAGWSQRKVTHSSYLKETTTGYRVGFHDVNWQRLC